MKIAVNTRLLIKGKMEGIGWFSFETLRRITQAHPEVEFIFIFDRKPSEEFIFSDNVKAVVTHPQARHPALWYLYFDFGVTYVLKKHKPELFLSPDGWLSLRTPTPQLAVIHDLNFEHHPEFIPPLVRKYYHYFFPRFARKAKRIATVSNYTKADLTEQYGIDPDKIDVVYNGVNQAFHPLTNSEIESVRREFSNGKGYFLFVGLIHPRKNLKNQIKAFLDMKESTDSDLKYLVVGSRYSWDREIDDVINNSDYGSDIVFLGRQEPEVLVKLYGAAFALTYVSYFEGFGIPIIEAMRAGVPVITSNTSSMPEIAGDFGLLADPKSIESISQAMGRLFESPGLRQKLVQGGIDRSKNFTWDRAASDLWNSIEKALDQTGS